MVARTMGRRIKIGITAADVLRAGARLALHRSAASPEAKRDLLEFVDDATKSLGEGVELELSIGRPRKRRRAIRAGAKP